MSEQRSTISENERTISSTCIALALLAGLMSPEIAELFFPYIMHFLFFVVVFSFCSLNTHLLDIISNVDRTSWIALTWQMLGIPALVTLACFLLNADSLTVAVLIATTTAGSVFASPALAHLVGLDRRMAIRTMLLSTLLMPVSLLIFGEINGFLPRDISLFTYVQHVVYFLLVPMVIAIAYWEATPKLTARSLGRAERGLHWLATLALMGFCVGVMSKLHASDEQHVGQVLRYIYLVAIIVVAAYIVTGLLFSHLGRRAALTIGMLAANRNVALSFALIAELLPRDVLAYVAVAQFPIFLTPLAVRVIQLSPISNRFGRLVTALGEARR